MQTLSRLAFLACVGAGLSQAGSGSGAQPTPAPPPFLAKDLAELRDMFAGRWDSERHGFFAAESGADPATLAPREHWVIGPSPAGETSLTPVSRRLLGGTPQTLTTTVGISGGWIVQRLSAGAGPAESGCAIHWRREGGGFSGQASGAGCAATFATPSGPLPVWNLTLSPTEFWIEARTGAATLETRLRRARVFACWTAILPSAQHGDDTTGRSDWQFQRGLLVHDQGGEVIVPNPAEPDRQVRLVLRDADWTYGDRRASLTLYVHEGASSRAVSYAWAEGGASRVGINLRWLQASCTLAPEATFDLP